MRTRKLIIATLTTFLFVAFNFAQAGSYNINRSCDSIKLTIAHKSLEEKYKGYMELADLYRYISSDSVIRYANLAYDHAKLQKNHHYKAEALFLLGMDYYKNLNFSKSIASLKLGLLNSQKTSDKILQGIGHLRLGQNYFVMDDFNNATKHFSNAYLLFDSCGSIEYKCHIIDILGYIYMDFGNLEEAKRYFLLESKLLVYDPKPYLIALSQLHYALVLIKQKKADESKEYLEYAKKTATTTKDIPRLLSIEREICNFYFNQGYRYYAINTLKKSINKASKTGISYEEANSLNTLAHFYQQVGMEFLALEAQKKVFTIRKRLNYTKIFCNALINLADAYSVVNNYDSALFYFNESLDLSISKGIKSEQTRAYKKMQAFYESNEKFAEALLCNEKYQLLRADFIENQTTNRASFMKNSYNKQSDMEELLAIEQNRNWNYSLIGFITILIFVLILGTIGYGYLELRKKNHLHSEIKYRLLLSQLYPRFVLESINTLKVEIQSDRLEESGTKLSDFARLIRTILINPINNFHLLERELNSMESYFCLQKMRLAPKFTYSIEVEPQIDPTNISIPPFLGHLLVEAWITLAAEIDTQDLFINSKFSLNNGILTQTFDTNIPFINLRLYGSLPTRDNLGTALQLLKTRFLFIQKSHALKLSFQLYQTISSDSNLTRCHAKLSIPLLPHATYPAIKG